MISVCRQTLAVQSFGFTPTISASLLLRRGLSRTQGNAKSSTSGGQKFDVPPPSTLNVATAAAQSAKPAISAKSSTSVSGGSMLSFPKDNPFTFQMIVATGKTMAADLMVQMVAEGKTLEEVDWKRNGIFVVFGFAYLGGFQWWLMVNKYRQWFPTMDKFAKMSFAEKIKYPAGIIDAAKMVIFDVAIHLPLMYFPTYYAVKECVVGHSWNPIDWVTDGVTKYVTNMNEDLTAMIKLWGPSDCVQFVLPLHIRMPFRHLVSFFWTAYVSFTRGAVVKDSRADDGTQQTSIAVE